MTPASSKIDRAVIPGPHPDSALKRGKGGKLRGFGTEGIKNAINLPMAPASTALAYLNLR